MSHLELPVSGMTCASCAARVERTLNGLDGVTATVNYATERATVDFDDEAVGPEQLVDAVQSAGYGARLPGAPRPDADEARGLRARLRVSAVLAVPVLALSMIAPLQFAGWEVVALALATPVVLWGAWPFHRTAWRGSAPHRDDGHAHQHRDPRRLAVVGRRRGDRRRAPLPRGRRGRDLFVLAGRLLESRAADGRARRWRRSCAPGHAMPRCSSRTGPNAASPSRSFTPATASSCAPASASPPTASSRTAPRRSTRRSSPASRARSRSTRATTSSAAP